jgi:uncharacterized protein with LGFP repeats
VSSLRARTSARTSKPSVALVLAAAGLTATLVAADGALLPREAAAAAEPSVANFELLAQCESGGRWHLNTGNGYYGGLQFSAATWNWIGFSGLPHQHSKETQIRAGQVLQARSGWGQWPACARKLDFHGSGGVQAPPTAIQARYAQLGGSGGFLGAPVSGEHRTPDGSGAFTHYQGGSLYWSPGTGPQVVRGAIRDAWAGLGWERSALRYPTTDELGTPDRVGRFNHFQHGSIYWTPATGAREVRGAIRDTWSRLGWERSALGYPTTHERTAPDGVGRFSHFQRGSVYWTPATGAQEVRGAIRDTWSRLGWERSALGYPTTGERPAAGGGRYSDFTGGSVYWTPKTGARELRTGIRNAWLAAGGPTSPLGFPTSDERRSADGTWRSSAFQDGVIYWSRATGYVPLFGEVHQAWLDAGGEQGPLGRPVEGTSVVPGGQEASFEGGTLVWDSASGVASLSVPEAADAEPSPGPEPVPTP